MILIAIQATAEAPKTEAQVVKPTSPAAVRRVESWDRDLRFGASGLRV